MQKKLGLTYARSVLLLAFASLPSWGQETSDSQTGKHTTTYLLGVGWTSQYDTYLSPVEYQGTQVNLVGNTYRQLKNLKSVTFQSLFMADLHSSRTRADGASYLGGDLHYDAGYHYNWDITQVPRLKLYAGGLVGLSAGGIYTTRGGNNPANAHANVRLSASIGARYQFNIWRLPLSIRYQADLPLVGAAFSPNYGQSYYEMWQKGGYDHNIVATYPGNAFSLKQIVTLNLHLGKRTALTLGYLGDIHNATLNKLRQHQYTHSILIGYAKSW